MMLGHALLAFAAVAAVAGLCVRPDRALTAGLVAGLFAAVPDVDVLFALPALVAGIVEVAAASGGVEVGDVFTVTASFWSASSEVHRSVTHSLVVAVPVSVAAGLLAAPSRDRSSTTAAVAVLVGVAVVGAVVSGVVAAAMLLVFGATVALAAGLVRRRTDLSGRAVAGLAAAGTVSHPFGDLFTGGPPRLLYPLGVDPLPERLLLSADPTLHLLGTFALEIVAVWAAALVACRLSDRSVLSYVRPVAVVGLAYGLVALAISPPTLAASYEFVFSVVAVGLVTAAVTWLRTAGERPFAAVDAQTDGGRDETAAASARPGETTGLRGVAAAVAGRVPTAPEPAATAAATGSAAVTLAWATYLGVYLAGLAPAG